MPTAQVGPWLAEAYALVWQHLQRLEVAAVGPPFARYTIEDDRMHVEAGFPVAYAVRAGAAVYAGSLPGGRVAVTTHLGRYEGLEDAYKAVVVWLAEHGYQQDGPHWEVYYTNPQDQPDTSQWRTDLFVPCVATESEATDGPS